jgi:hypothetical protein
MMAVVASIELDGIAAMKASDIRAAARVAMQKVGDYWIKTYLPLHFENTAFFRYKYTPRNPRYRKRKLNFGEIDGVQAIGEDRPLVWSGRSRERAKAARAQGKSPSAKFAYADITIDAPALNFRPTGSRIDMRDEATRVNQQEVNTLGDLFAKEFDKELVTLGAKKRRYRKVA